MPFRNPNVWAEHLTDTRHEAGPSEVMDPTEMEAMKRAGRDAGGFLMEIGKTDMAALSKDEWTKFCSVMLVGFELHMAGLKNGVCS